MPARGRQGFWKIGKMEKRVFGKSHLEREVNKVNMRITSLLKPTFQYSTIPLFHVLNRSSGLGKKPLFSICCTNSEMFNYGP